MRQVWYLLSTRYQYMYLKNVPYLIILHTGLLANVYINKRTVVILYITLIDRFNHEISEIFLKQFRTLKTNSSIIFRNKMLVFSK